jgi:tripeptide aminopeptidase
LKKIEPMDFTKAFETTADRFIRYAKIDTQADPASSSSPSTAKQKNLSVMLFQELTAAGIQAETDEFGYVYARIPANNADKKSKIFFCAHVDTAPDCSGTDVKPILHEHYNGGDLVLPDDSTVVISPADFPDLNQKIGLDLITASGHTLLGADDKAGVTAIMEAALFLKKHPDIEHGEMIIFFTTDEEIGHGVDHVNIQKLGADFGYTLDGGPIGSLEDETFSADACTIKIKGVSTHPGYAKGKMENAIKIAGEILAALPKHRMSPESTEDYEGFVHPTRLEGNLEHAEIDFIIRDFVTSKLDQHVAELTSICQQVMDSFPNSNFEISRKEQYRNMKEVLDKHPEVCRRAEEAITASGLKLIKGHIRGGTDGSRLSFMGLPCPNLFAGEYGIHSKKEWVCVQDMQKASEVIIRMVSA